VFYVVKQTHSRSSEAARIQKASGEDVWSREPKYLTQKP